VFELFYLLQNIKGMCTPDQPDHFICPSTEVFGTASVVWGLIGPGRIFSPGKIYYILTFFFIIGAVTPIISWLITRRYPNSFFKYVNFPVIYSGTGAIPPATAVNYVSWGIVGFIFQYYIRRRNFPWWNKYNYILSAALDSGVALGAVLVFFTLQFPKDGTIGANNVLKWWGNVGAFNNTDGNSVPLKTVAPGMTFGPTSW
jgi:OPT family oligopeptide transporter